MKTIKDLNYSYNHVKDRLIERYNMEIDRKFYDDMNKKLEPYIGSPDFGTDNNGDQEIHSMFLRDKTVKVVYSISKNRITTVLL
jgi:hypothetical protein